jgi:hypothetical protein
VTDNLRIDTGVKRLTINNDPNRVIEFNPGDVVFSEKFYRLMANFKEKEKEFTARSEEIEANEEIGEDGFPVRYKLNIALMDEVCTYLKEQIDLLIGPGTSDTVFGDVKNLGMFDDFFSGIIPYMEDVRGDKLKKHIAPKKGKTMK